MDLTGAIASKGAGRVQPFFRDAAGISNLHFNSVFCFEEIPWPRRSGTAQRRNLAPTRADRIRLH